MLKSKLSLLASLAFVCLAANSHADNKDSVKFLPNDGASNDRFGFSVAVEGDTIAIGAPGIKLTGSSAGAVYLYEASTGLQTAKLVPNDGASDDLFGRAIALDGSTLVVGAQGALINAVETGAVYLFDTGTGLLTGKLTASDGEALDQFGYAVAVSGTTAVIGARFDGDNGLSSGSAYLFDTLNNQEIAKLLPSDGATLNMFGSSVAISGSTAIVGSPGSDAVYIFDAVTGQQIARLAEGDPDSDFGFSVAISGTTVVVGAPLDPGNGVLGGTGYVFDVTTGQLLFQLILPTFGFFDAMGYSAAIGDDLILLGGSEYDAYLYDLATGRFLSTLSAQDTIVSDYFGQATALDGGLAIVGANGDDDNGPGSGSSYLFDVSAVVPASTSVRNGGGMNALILSSSTVPALGANWDASLDSSGHAPGSGVLLIYDQPTAGIFLGGGELLVDVSSLLLSASLLPHTGGIVTFSEAIPTDSALCGFRAYAQGAVFGAPGYELSNALDLLVGF